MEEPRKLPKVDVYEGFSIEGRKANLFVRSSGSSLVFTAPLDIISVHVACFHIQPLCISQIYYVRVYTSIQKHVVHMIPECRALFTYYITVLCCSSCNMVLSH